MRSIIIFLLFFVLMLAALSNFASAQMACGNYDKVTAKLNDKYGEVRKNGMLAGPDALFETWASSVYPNTWTYLKITPDKLACVMAVGDGYRDYEPEIFGPST